MDWVFINAFIAGLLINILYYLTILPVQSNIYYLRILIKQITFKVHGIFCARNFIIASPIISWFHQILSLSIYLAVCCVLFCAIHFIQTKSFVQIIDIALHFCFLNSMALCNYCSMPICVCSSDFVNYDVKHRRKKPHNNSTSLDRSFVCNFLFLFVHNG